MDEPKPKYRSSLLAATMIAASTPILGISERAGWGTEFDPDNLAGFVKDEYREWPVRSVGPMTDEQIRASAAQMKACKPQRPNRSRKSKAKKSKR